MTDIEQRLDRLESREAIRELVTAYAVTNDEHDVPALVDLFTDDGALLAPNGAMSVRGRDAISDHYVSTFKIRGPSYHWTHDVTIEFQPGDPDRASGLVLGHAETCPNGIVSIAALRYVDDYRRENGSWRFARREMQFLYYLPVSEFGESLTRADRVVLGDRRVAADFPERLPAWRAFIEDHGPLEL